MQLRPSLNISLMYSIFSFWEKFLHLRD
jgi:hypothetical protein